MNAVKGVHRAIGEEIVDEEEQGEGGGGGEEELSDRKRKQNEASSDIAWLEDLPTIVHLSNVSL